MSIMRRLLRYLLLLWLLVAPIVLAIYADQAGEADFLLQLVGEPSGRALTQSDHIFLATAKGVLACFHEHTGELVWRALLDNSPLKHFIWVKSSVIVVSKGATRVSALDANTGHIIWEKPLPLPQNTNADVVEISFDSVLNSVRVLAHNAISFLTTEGELMWQFIPEDSYSHDSIKFDRKDTHAGHKGTMRLVISSLALPSSPKASKSKEAFLGCGCFTSEDSESCLYTAVISADLQRRSVDIAVYPALAVSPKDLRTNVRSFIDESVDTTAAVFGVSLRGVPSLQVMPLSGNAVSPTDYPMAGSLSEPPEVFVVESDDDALTLFPAVSYCTEKDCLVVTPKSPSGGMLQLLSCPGETGLSIHGYERSLHHSFLARYFGCSSLVGHSLKFTKGSMTHTMAVNSESALFPVQLANPIFDMKGLSILAKGFVLVSSRGQILITHRKNVVAVREESLAHILHALVVGPPLDKSVLKSVPSLQERLSMQHDIFMKWVQDSVITASNAIEVLMSTSPLIVFQKLIHGEYTDRRKTLESKNTLFGFNKQAVCITAVNHQLKVVTLDILKRKPVDFVVPLTPGLSGEIIDRVSVLHGDDYDQELLIVMKTSSRNLYIWSMPHGVPHGGVRYIDPSFVSYSGQFKAVASVHALSSDGKRQYALVIYSLSIISRF